MCSPSRPRRFQGALRSTPSPSTAFLRLPRVFRGAPRTPNAPPKGHPATEPPQEQIQGPQALPKPPQGPQGFPTTPGQFMLLILYLFSIGNPLKYPLGGSPGITPPEAPRRPQGSPRRPPGDPQPIFGPPGDREDFRRNLSTNRFLTHILYMKR